jgi:molybdate transport system substrate-binding protein
VRAGEPRPDIATVDAFKSLVVGTRAIAMVDPAAGGTTGIYLFRLYEQWGIADQVRAKAVLVPGGLSAEKLVNGQADVAVQQMSELLVVPGVQVVGPLPAAIQSYTVYAGALSSQAAQADAARQVLMLLQGPEMEAVLKARGMEKPH